MYARAHPPWNPSWPISQDAGKEIQVLAEDGSVIQGTLRIHRVIRDARGNEIPIFVLEEASGQRRPFVDYDQWRFLSERPQ